jgi:hypothetical protein
MTLLQSEGEAWKPLERHWCEPVSKGGRIGVCHPQAMAAAIAALAQEAWSRHALTGSLLYFHFIQARACGMGLLLPLVLCRSPSWTHTEGALLIP